jgi:hypothetical protein
MCQFSGFIFADDVSFYHPFYGWEPKKHLPSTLEVSLNFISPN